MSYEIQYPDTVLNDLQARGIVPATMASTQAAAAILAAFYGAGFMSANYDSRFIVEHRDSEPVENFQTVVICVQDAKDEVLNDGSVNTMDLEFAIKAWAAQSDVQFSRGARISIVSTVDRITEPGVTTLVWEVMLSTMVIYNHRRAVINFGARPADLDKDYQNLVNKIQQINDQLTVSIF